jgi:integrase
LHSDGHRLYLLVKADGRKSWIFRYCLAGKQHDIGFGSALDVSLAEARVKATDANQLLLQGIDPLVHKKAAAVRVDVPTFGAVATDFIAMKTAESRNAKHAAQIRMTLEQYAKPLWDLPVNAIGIDDVLRVLQPHWTERPETASRLRGRIESVLDTARAKGLRDGENPARWKGHLDKLLPRAAKLSRGHHAALPYADMPAFMLRLREQEGVGAKALEFTILTAARSGEVRGMEWREVDLDSKVWAVPASRMKAGREHRVPLTERAVAVLRAMAEANRGDLVFPGAGGKALSDMTLAAVLKRMSVDVTVHGFRSSFRDWAGDETHFAREIAEACLAHSVGDQVEAAYRRSDALERRRELLSAWGRYLDEPREGNILPLRRAGS